MVTVVTKTIGTASRDYSTLQAWEDAAPANLVTADQVWRGECYADAEFTAALTVSGSTVDATRYKELTVAAGQSFADHANKLTNALRYNASNGAALRSTTAWGTAITISEDYFRLERMQVQHDSFNGHAIGGGGANVTIDQCIVESKGGRAANLYIGAVLKNSLFISRKAGTEYIVGLWNSTVSNCIFAAPSNITPPTYGIRHNYWTAFSAVNLGVFGAANLASNTTGGTFTACATDRSSPPSGFTTVAYDTSTGSGFENTLDGTHDYRIKSTSALKDAGTSTGAPSVDIVGTTRPQGALYDIGPWEYSSGGTTLTVTFIDAAAGLDVASALSAMSATLTDATAAIELITSTATRAASLQEAASAVDLCAAAATMLASLTESTAGVDAQSAALVANATLLDAVLAADLASAMATMAATLTDSASALDLLTATRIANAAALEAAAAVDLVSAGNTANAQVQEAASTADALSAATTLVVQLVEAIAASDATIDAAERAAQLVDAVVGADTLSGSVFTARDVSVVELVLALDAVRAAIGLALQGHADAVVYVPAGPPGVLVPADDRRVIVRPDDNTAVLH